MKKIVLVILFLSFIRITMGIIYAPFGEDVCAQNQTTVKNELFKSRIQSPLWNREENDLVQTKNSQCPMCGGISFGGGTCGSCNYLSGTALGASEEKNVSMDMNVFCFLLFALFYMIFKIFYLSRSKKNLIKE